MLYTTIYCVQYNSISCSIQFYLVLNTILYRVKYNSAVEKMFETVKFAYLLCVIFADKSIALFNHESTSFNHESNTQNGQNEITKIIKVPVPVPVPLHVPCPDAKPNDYNV